MHQSILFVDDDPVALSAMRALVSCISREWELVFANGGARALEILAEREVGVLVSDMRMSCPDGAELLEVVQEKHPTTVRIVVTSLSYGPEMARAAALAHQCLGKPCDPGELISAIRSTACLRDRLSDQRLLELATRLTSLPSLPHLYTQIMEQLRLPDGSMKSVGEIIAQDVGMTAKILKLVNSAFFGLNREITRVEEAVGFLGIETLRALVLSADLFQLDGNADDAALLEDLSNHGLRTAHLAQAIMEAEQGTRREVDQAFLAGMLHDAGKLVLLNNVREESEKAEALASSSTSMSSLQAERAVLGASHADVGAYLLGIWGLPSPVVEAIAFHHTPSESTSHEFDVLAAVHVADALDRSRGVGEEPSVNGIDGEYLARINRGSRVPFWQQIHASVVGEVEA